MKKVRPNPCLVCPIRLLFGDNGTAFFVRPSWTHFCFKEEYE